MFAVFLLTNAVNLDLDLEVNFSSAINFIDGTFLRLIAANYTH